MNGTRTVYRREREAVLCWILQKILMCTDLVQMNPTWYGCLLRKEMFLRQLN